MGGNPLSAVGASAADHPVGTQQTLGHRLETGLKVLDRAWPIVVHSRPRHKGDRYWLVTAR